ncbi:hypothetical protein [Hyphomonas sp.]|uniref:hypothetical protein n=1 Tax=Hyphomonas sp. TaxID=87 RepID=UPI0025B8B37B|nr:hypothetical protein [Hyphomonas sp.]
MLVFERVTQRVNHMIFCRQEPALFDSFHQTGWDKRIAVTIMLNAGRSELHDWKRDTALRDFPL